MTTPALPTFTTIITSALGTQTGLLKLVALPDGSAINTHFALDTSGNPVDLATDATVQAATAAILSALAAIA